MNAKEYVQQLKAATAQFKEYINNEWSKRCGQIAIRFINGNFRA